MIATTANAAKATATMPIFFMPELLPDLGDTTAAAASEILECL